VKRLRIADLGLRIWVPCGHDKFGKGKISVFVTNLPFKSPNRKQPKPFKLHQKRKTGREPSTVNRWPSTVLNLSSMKKILLFSFLALFFTVAFQHDAFAQKKGKKKKSSKTDEYFDDSGFAMAAISISASAALTAAASSPSGYRRWWATSSSTTCSR
jgi:hypothetical protein